MIRTFRILLDIRRHFLHRRCRFFKRRRLLLRSGGEIHIPRCQLIGRGTDVCSTFLDLNHDFKKSFGENIDGIGNLSNLITAVELQTFVQLQFTDLTDHFSQWTRQRNLNIKIGRKDCKQTDDRGNNGNHPTQ